MTIDDPTIKVLHDDWSGEPRSRGGRGDRLVTVAVTHPSVAEAIRGACAAIAATEGVSLEVALDHLTNYMRPRLAAA